MDPSVNKELGLTFPLAVSKELAQEVSIQKHPARKPCS